MTFEDQATPRVAVRQEGALRLPVLVWQWATPKRSIASGPLGGGIGLASWVLNAQVPDGYSRLDPDSHLIEIAEELGLAGEGAGMLTAAEVPSYETGREEGLMVSATVGLRHPIMAADVDAATARSARGPADDAVARVGTINVQVLFAERLSDAALVNAVSTVTEAKVQALFAAGLAATGTATDAVCVACETDGPAIPFCGPRSPLGSRLARAAYEAVLAGALKSQTPGNMTGETRGHRQ